MNNRLKVTRRKHDNPQLKTAETCNKSRCVYLWKPTRTWN